MALVPDDLRSFLLNIRYWSSVVWDFLSSDYAFLMVGLALILYFPLSVWAYDKYQGKTRIKQLQKDFEVLFGSDPKEVEADFRAVFSPGNFLPHVILVCLVTFIGTWLLLKAPNSFEFIATDSTVQAMRYGFLGAYLFSAQLIYRRFTTLDLQPGVFMYCSLTLIAGLMFNYVAFEAINHAPSSSGEQSSGFAAGMSAILAFSLGYFPALAITWFNRLAFAGLGVGDRHENEKPLALIQGISRFHETRLRDNGIDNVQNIASADIKALLEGTTFSAQEVIDWIDQAILILYLDETSITTFRQSGIRAVSDFMDVWNSVNKNDQDEVSAISQQLKTTRVQLEMLVTAMKKGPNIHHVVDYWKEISAVTAQRRAVRLHFVKRKLRDAANVVLSELYQPSEDAWATGLDIERLMQDYEQGDERPLNKFTTPELLGLAKYLFDLGKLDDACRIYTMVLDVDPDNVTAINNLAFVSLQLASSDAEHENVVKLAEKGLDIAGQSEGVGPDAHAFLHQSKAIALTQLNNLDEALKSMTSAARIEGLSDDVKNDIDSQIANLEVRKASTPPPV